MVLFDVDFALGLVNSTRQVAVRLRESNAEVAPQVILGDRIMYVLGDHSADHKVSKIVLFSHQVSDRKKRGSNARARARTHTHTHTHTHPYIEGEHDSEFLLDGFLPVVGQIVIASFSVGLGLEDV